MIRRAIGMLLVFHIVMHSYSQKISLVNQGKFELNRFAPSMSLSPDNRLLAFAHYDTISVFNLKTNEVVKSISRSRRDLVTSHTCFNKNGELIAIGGKSYTTHDIEIWNIQEQKLKKTLRISQGKRHPWLRKIIFSSDGKLIAAGDDNGVISIWEVDSGKEIRVIKDDSKITDIDFSPNSQYIVSGNQTGLINVWDINSGKAFRGLKGHVGYITGLSFSPDGHSIASSCEDRTIKIWDFMSGKCLRTIHGPDVNTASIGFTSDGKTVIAVYHKFIKLIDIKTGLELVTSNFNSIENDFFAGEVNINGNFIAIASSRNTTKVITYILKEETNDIIVSGSKPTVTWLNPITDTLKTSNTKINLTAQLESESPILNVELLIDNKPYRLRDFEIVDADSRVNKARIEQEILLTRKNSPIYITLKVINKNGTTSSSKIVQLVEDFVINPPKPKPTPVLVKEKRLALVIGNSIYRYGNSLPNPKNDADSMETVLKQLGFEVIKAKDQTLQQLDKVIRNFTNQLKNYDVGLFFYAGHGIELNGTNYIIPVDAEKLDKSDVEYKCINTSWLQERMAEAGAYNKTNIVILDACRNNPFRNWRTYNDEDVWAPPAKVPSGLIVAYAASQGQKAYDGDASNGLYTSTLLKHIRTKDLEIKNLFMRVRVDLLQKGSQTPQESVQLFREFYFAQ